MNRDPGHVSRYSGPATAWDALPPKRQRFYLWAFLWWVLAFVPVVPLRLLGAPPWSTLLIVPALACLHLVPLGRAARDELRQRRATGEELPTAPVTAAALAGWTLAAVGLWALFGWLVVASGEFVGLPVLPALVTVIAVARFWRRRAPGTTPDAGSAPARPPHPERS